MAVYGYDVFPPRTIELQPSTCLHCLPVASLLVAMPGAPSSVLVLVVRPGAPSSVLAPALQSALGVVRLHRPFSDVYKCLCTAGHQLGTEHWRRPKRCLRILLPK